MKYLCTVLILIFLSVEGFAQIQFVERLEIETKPNEENFMIFPYKSGVLGFRVHGDRGLVLKRKFQYFLGSNNLEKKDLREVELPDYHDLIAYDFEGEFLYVLIGRTSIGKDRKIYRINLENSSLEKFDVSKILQFDLQDFQVLDERAIMMGLLDGRPVVQVFDIEEESVFTLQGIYANDAKIIQLQKQPETGVFDVVMSRRDMYKNKLISVLTFDLDGQKLREVKIDKLDDPKYEILEAVLTEPSAYRQAMFGPFGLRKKDAFQGIYFANINEFGEYFNHYYTIEDFPNFYNYLPERARKRRNKSVERAIEREKSITIPNVLATREVMAFGDGYLIYNDYFSPSSSRYMYNRNFYPGSEAYFNQHQRMYPALGTGMTAGGMGRPINYQFKYMAAQFMFVDSQGKLLWENSLPLGNKITHSDQKFGQVSFDGRDLYFLYLDKADLVLSHVREGEVLMENEKFEIELINDKERIRDTPENSLSLTWWYDNYYLLTGTQKVRYQTESGREANRHVFFVTKIKVDNQQMQFAEDR
ncbi:transcriptional regulator [Litoribacter alkaliphilus]|uniref:Transcriptional regulator n=1 Tax=Litoribacter ruber TaxID=702568 RepID=A0AAP2CJJ6_9BACT|nr:transcriptional regulator [Litoribacter alkaliphilus]MBS9524904.1 transcriptional regulator [Litoribacter alkaliphilus]